MANKFKKGDVVVLKSGGPKMTVQGNHVLRNPFGPSQTVNDEYDVTWMNKDSDGNYTQKWGKFGEEELLLNTDHQ